MENEQIVKKQNSGLIIVLVITLLCSMVGLGAVGFLTWKDKKAAENTKIEIREPDIDVEREFTSDKVFEPTGNIVDLVKNVSPSVVTVITKTQTQNLFTDEIEEKQSGVGTGFFVSEDGLLITNEHVVCEAENDPKNLTVLTVGDKSFDVESVAVDPVLDIAILKVNPKSEKLPYLKFANPESDVLIGQDVIAIGNPLGINPGSVTKGIISGINRNISAQGACGDQVSIRDYEGVMQTDAAINSGNSGGPLLNLNGEVVAVNAATNTGANNISYSIPFDRVLRVLDKYQKNNGKLTSIFFGVEYTMIDPNVAKSSRMPQGAYIRRVLPDSPAAKANIRRGDIIIKVEDKKIDFSLKTTINQYFDVGQKVKVEVYRQNSEDLEKNTPLEGKYITLDMILEESK